MTRFRGGRRKHAQPGQTDPVLEMLGREMRSAMSLADVLTDTLSKSGAPFPVIAAGLLEATIRTAMAVKPVSRKEAYDFVLGLLVLLRDTHEAGRAETDD